VSATPLAAARRVVVKIGSSLLTNAGAGLDREAIADWVRQVAKLRSRGVEVLVVSSGAIAEGMKRLGWSRRPRAVHELQAAAAVGQMGLVQVYESCFRQHGLHTAQVLLTHADLADRIRSNNARAALAELLLAGAVPILNENDSVAVDEIKFGDNDQLSAMVAPLVDADLLVLLSDVAGLLDARGDRVAVVTDVVRDALPLVRPTKSSGGTGGMASKVEAARRATMAGAHAVIADASAEDVLGRVLAGDDIGTLFCPSTERLSARRYWIAFTLRAQGDLVLDRGAAAAVKSKGKSVLAIGVLGVRGDFREGDSVRIVDPDGAEIGRGLARAAAMKPRCSCTATTWSSGAEPPPRGSHADQPSAPKGSTCRHNYMF
jgi:glutamate 5-kinase